MRLRRIICIIVLSAFRCDAQFRYDVLQKECQIDDDIKDISVSNFRSFITLLGDVYVKDSAARNITSLGRMTTEASDKLIVHTDSMNFQSLKLYAEKYGLPMSLKSLFKDSAERYKTEFKKYLMFIHLSDRFGAQILQFLEKSIYLKVSNRAELENYFFTYLWRCTEFDKKGQYYIVPLPDLQNSYFKNEYIQTLSVFINKYVKTSKNQVQYMVLASYYTQSFTSFINKTADINRQLKEHGCPPSYVNFYDLLYFTENSVRNFPILKTIWKNTTNKYYLVCSSNLSLEYSPFQTFINK